MLSYTTHLYFKDHPFERQEHCCTISDLCNTFVDKIRTLLHKL